MLSEVSAGQDLMFSADELFEKNKIQIYLSCEITHQGSSLSLKDCKHIFSPPRIDASQEENDLNLSNLTSICKAISARIHVEFEQNYVKFIFEIKIEVPDFSNFKQNG
jgi:hypothetical protein